MKPQLSILPLLLAMLFSLGCSQDGAPSGEKSARAAENPSSPGKSSRRTAAADPAAEKKKLHKKLQGEWVGDRKAYQKANPGGGAGEAANAFLLYIFKDSTMRFGTSFDRAASRADFEVVETDKNRVKIEIQPIGGQKQYAWITFVDNDHIKLIWNSSADSGKQAWLKRK